MKKLYILSITLISLTFTSCQKWLDVKPEGVALEEDAIKTQADLQAALNGTYDVAANQYNGRVQLFNELMGDNLERPQSGFTVPIYNHTTNFFNSDVSGLYLELYRTIFRSNYIMERVNDGSIAVDGAAKTRMEAEARFLRALCHFDLVRIWAQPYGYTADNSHLGVVIKDKTELEVKPRATVGEVYNFIIGDLNAAIASLPEANGNYAKKDAAKALLAKVYFQMNRFGDVRTLCDELIPKYSLDDTLNRFYNARTSTETIFAFVSSGVNDNRASGFINNFRIVNPSNPPAYRLSRAMYLSAVADTADQRSKLYAIFNAGTETETYGIHKFDYDFLSTPILYLTQLKLMRAEALAQLGLNLSQAIGDINDIRRRAYGSNSYDIPSGISATDIIAACRSERRKEFPCEGDRVQELKRIGALEDPGKTGSVKIRESNWFCPGMALQFPVNEKTSLFIFNEEGGCN